MRSELTALTGEPVEWNVLGSDEEVVGVPEEVVAYVGRQATSGRVDGIEVSPADAAVVESVLQRRLTFAQLVASGDVTGVAGASAGPVGDGLFGMLGAALRRQRPQTTGGSDLHRVETGSGQAHGVHHLVHALPVEEVDVGVAGQLPRRVGSVVRHGFVVRSVEGGSGVGTDQPTDGV